MNIMILSTPFDLETRFRWSIVRDGRRETAVLNLEF